MRKNNYFVIGLFRIICTVFFLLSFSVASAQSSKGLWMAGGTLGFNHYEDQTSFNITPNGGYLFSDHLSVGLSLNFSGYFSENRTSLVTGINPFGRYYFGSGKTQPFLLASAGYNYRKFTYNRGNDENYHSSSWKFAWNAAAGVSHFLNNNVAIEGFIGYNRILYINFGFQIFLKSGKY